jgi:putative oxidoreductase
MFSTFPDGWPGAGILLLRAAAASGLIVQSIAYFVDNREPGLLTLILAVIAIVLGALLLIGCLTRFVAVVAAVLCLAGMFAWFPGPRVGIFESPTTDAFAIVIAVALTCLGAGAFSIDARLFGRHEVIIPKNPPYSK